jgi:hypothetical protein
MQTISYIADVIGILGGFFALFAWLQTRRLWKELHRERTHQISSLPSTSSFNPNTKPS